MKFLIKTTIFYVICVALAYWITGEFQLSLILGFPGTYFLWTIATGFFFEAPKTGAEEVDEYWKRERATNLAIHPSQKI